MTRTYLLELGEAFGGGVEGQRAHHFRTRAVVEHLHEHHRITGDAGIERHHRHACARIACLREQFVASPGVVDHRRARRIVGILDFAVLAYVGDDSLDRVTLDPPQDEFGCKLRARCDGVDDRARAPRRHEARPELGAALDRAVELLADRPVPLRLDRIGRPDGPAPGLAAKRRRIQIVRATRGRYNSAHGLTCYRSISPTTF